MTPVAVDTTNISRNPQYADTLSFDYHLLVHSGGIDTGDPAGPNDPGRVARRSGRLRRAGRPHGGSRVREESRRGGARNDTTINLAWDELGGGAASYAVYGSTTPGFPPARERFPRQRPAPGFSFSPFPRHGLPLLPRLGRERRRATEADTRARRPPARRDPTSSPRPWPSSYPNGGEIFEIGDTIRIDWSATDNRRVDSVSVYYSDDAGDTYTLLAHGWPADSSYRMDRPIVPFGFVPRAGRRVSIRAASRRGRRRATRCSPSGTKPASATRGTATAPTRRDT